MKLHFTNGIPIWGSQSTHLQIKEAHVMKMFEGHRGNGYHDNWKNENSSAPACLLTSLVAR